MGEREQAARQELYRPHGYRGRRPSGSTFNGAQVYHLAPGTGGETPAGAPVDAAGFPARGQDGK